MASIWTMGEILVEIMRPQAGMPLGKPGAFLGPFPSGAPAIFVDTAARLGCKAGIIGGVGEDEFGDCVTGRLEQDGVDIRFVQRISGRATAVAFVTYFADGSRKFIYHIDGTPAVMAGFPGVQVVDTGFFHVMGCSLMASDRLRDEILRTMTAFHSAGTRVSFDPNIRPELLRGRSVDDVVRPVLERCSVLLPGTAELNLLSGEPDVEQGIAVLFDRYPLEIIALKRGRQGCAIYSRTGRRCEVPAYQIEEVDPTGAGDSFDAGFLCGLLESLPLEVCARIAAACGALNAAAFGPMEGGISRTVVDRLIASQ